MTKKLIATFCILSGLYWVGAVAASYMIEFQGAAISLQGVLLMMALQLVKMIPGFLLICYGLRSLRYQAHLNSSSNSVK